MSEKKAERGGKSPAVRAARKLRLVIHRLLHGVSPMCPRCMCEFMRQARIEYAVDIRRPSLFRRVFRCDKCKAEFASGFMVVPPRKSKS